MQGVNKENRKGWNMGTLCFTPNYSINLKLLFKKQSILKHSLKEFPDGSVVRTPHLLCRKSGFSPGQGTKTLLCNVVKNKSKQLNKQTFIDMVSDSTLQLSNCHLLSFGVKK